MSRAQESALHRVVRQLREAIEAGDHPPGALLPGEKQLAAQLEVSGPTLSIALAVLAAEGRVETRNGFGTVVLAPAAPIRLILFDPGDPLQGLTFSGDPAAGHALADPYTAAVLGMPPREVVHTLSRTAVHGSGAKVRYVRVLPQLALDGMERASDPFGPRGAILEALSKAHGPLSHGDRHGHAVPTGEDRAALDLPAFGGCVNHVSAVLYAADGRGLMIDSLRYNPAQAEASTLRG